MRFVHSLRYALVAALSAGMPATHAATIVVDTLADTAVADGFCSLREAISSANVNNPIFDCSAGSGGSDRITFLVGGTIELTANLPSVIESLAIVGSGRDLLTIDGMQLYQPLQVESIAPLLLIRDLTITRGLNANANGGGCLYAGGATSSLALIDLKLDHCLSRSTRLL